jgi:hypothetical protein
VGLAVRPSTIGAVRTESPADYGTKFGMTKWTATSVRSRPRRSSRGANAERQQYGADRPPTEQPRLAGLDPKALAEIFRSSDRATLETVVRRTCRAIRASQQRSFAGGNHRTRHARGRTPASNDPGRLDVLRRRATCPRIDRGHGDAVQYGLPRKK